MDYIYYYSLLGISKIRSFFRKFRKSESYETFVIKNNGTTLKYDNDNPIIYADDKLICVFKNGYRYISCAQEFDKGFITFPANEIILQPCKFIEVSILPNGVDIIENFEKFIVNDNCKNKVSWKDILSLEDIEITYLTTINVVDINMNDVVYEDLEFLPFK